MVGQREGVNGTGEMLSLQLLERRVKRKTC